MFFQKTISAMFVSAALLAEPAFAQAFRFRVASPGVVSTTAPATPAAPTVATATNGAWSDGTYGKSCLEYLTGDATHTPTNANGTYTIKPVATPYSVTCDMTGGGWTRFDYMVAGIMPFPGNGMDVYTQRVQAAYLTMYKELAGVSTLQKLVGVTGDSESGSDKYSFHTQSKALVAGTSTYSGGFGTRDLQLTVNRDWNAAFGFTFFHTDGSVAAGSGGGVPAVSWFK